MRAKRVRARAISERSVAQCCLPSMREPTSPTRFFVLVFGSTWLFQLPYLLAQRGVVHVDPNQLMPFVVLGFFGPLFIALLLSRGQVRSLLAPLVIARVSPWWYALALGLPCAIFMAARALLAPFADNLGPWLYPPLQAQQLAAMLVIPFTEQIPWRGYVYPRLERSHGPVLASLLTGAAWAAFHVQKHAFIDPNASLASAALTIAYMTSGTVVFSWVYLRTRGSMLLVVVTMMGNYLNNPTQALPNLVPLAIHTLGFCAVALALVLFDRKVWIVSREEAMTSRQHRREVTLSDQ
jgi:membrane protease YdiL (CAAX protease family)